MKVISVDMVEAIKVQFIKPIFEDDFPEKGMTAWLTDIEWTGECYKLYFDFAEFEAENQKYFKETYYKNLIISQKIDAGLLKKKSLYTAIEADCYKPKYSVFFSADHSEDRNDLLFKETICNYLRAID